MFSEFENWKGSQDELVAAVNQLELAVFEVDKPVKKRTLVYYRSQGIISAPIGKKYDYHHILQFLLSRKLVREGWTIKQLAQTVPTQTTDNCLQLIKHKGDIWDLIDKLKNHSETNTSNPPSKIKHLPAIEQTDVPLPELTAKILALGVLQLFEQTISQNQIIDSRSLNKNLIRAMGMLGRLCISEGLEDSFASVHNTLALCRLPFAHPDWPLACFSDSHFPYQLTNLIDIDLRTPTSDCLALASFGGERNIREYYHFEQLMLTCESFGYRKTEVYTLLREFIARSPMTTKTCIERYLQEHNIKSALRFLLHECFRDIEPAWFGRDKLYKCSECGAPLKPISHELGNCIIKQCRMHHQHVELLNEVDNTSLLMLKPHLLSDWFGPAVDEIYIYDLAVELLLDVELYPDMDACDIQIDGHDIGIDIKSYASPHLLARQLTHNIGGLTNYHHKVVAINDAVLRRTKGYMDILRQEYKGSVPLEFKSVKDLSIWLQEAR